MSFGEYITNGVANAKSLLKVCFTDKDITETKLHDGMFARPHVGATTIYSKLEEMEQKKQNSDMSSESSPQDEPLVRLFKDAVKAGTRIAVVGSSFGGTGSGGVPALAQYLKESLRSRFVHAFLTLSWFDLDDHDKNERFESNTAGGLRFYSMSPKFSEKLGWTVAAYPWHTIREKQGDSRQTETPHAFNLILAAAVRRFFGEQNNYPGGRTFCLPDNATCIYADSSPLLTFDIARNNTIRGEQEELQDLAQITQGYRLALEGLADYVEHNFQFGGGPLSLIKETKQSDHPLNHLLIRVQTATIRTESSKGTLIGWATSLLTGKNKSGIDESVRITVANELRKLSAQAYDTLKWLGCAQANAGGQARLVLDDAVLCEKADEVFARIPSVIKVMGGGQP